MNIEKIKSDINKLIGRGEEVLRSPGRSDVKRSDEIGFRVSALSYLSNLLGDDHEFYLQYRVHSISGHYIHTATGLAILRSLREDIDESWLFDLKQLIAAELFTDFLDMAEHLIEEGYKDAAAVMVGSTLESHLKQLCIKNGIETIFINDKGKEKHIRADRLNADLKKSGIYKMTMQKQITAWLGLRNNAAHGDYDEYDMDEVKQMYSGVLSFIARTSD